MAKKVKEGSFVIFYVKDKQLYPVALSSEENKMLQLVVKGVLQNKVTLFDEPQGEVKNWAK